MSDVSYYLVNENTGKTICPLPFTPTGPAQRILNGCGQFNGTVPLYHPSTITENIQGLPAGVRGLTAVRPDGTVAWAGPITAIGQTNLRSNTVPIVASEPSWWLSKRTLETDKHYDADLYYIARDLFNYMLNKESNGLTSGGSSINAALPGFTISPASGNSGVTKHIAFAGVDGLVLSDIFNDLVKDATGGIDYKVSYGGHLNAVTRVFTVGAPSLGTTININLNEHILFDFGKQEDLNRAATRVTVIGNGYTYRSQNTGSVTAGTPLLEAVFNRTDTSDVATIQAFAKDARRVAQPPLAPVTFSYVPSDASGPVPWGWCDLGDKLPLRVAAADSILFSLGSQRIVQLDWYPPAPGSAETVVGTMNLPLDQLGT